MKYYFIQSIYFETNREMKKLKFTHSIMNFLNQNLLYKKQFIKEKI